MRKRHNAFTLAEMLVVMGIIIIFIAMAVPAVRALTGSSSISSARNNLSALVTHAREEAVGMQDIRGVVFILDPAHNQVVGYICQAATIQDPNLPTITMLDLVPSEDAMALPTGVRLQTIFNGIGSQSSTANPNDDHYMGFNPLTTTGNPPFVGGVILFDGNGRLIVRQYGFQMSQPGATATSYVPSTLNGVLWGMYTGGATTPPSYTIGPISNGSVGSFAYVQTMTASTSSTTSVPYSQLGMVLFDYDAFRSANFGDQDADITGKSYTGTPTGQTQSESTEEAWIDTNSTPVLVNRYNGTLIRGE